MTRRLIALLLAVALMAVCFPLSVFGNNETDSQNQESDGSEGQKIKVGYIDYGSFIEKKNDGTMFGYGCEYLNELKKYGDWDYEYVYNTWEKSCELLKSGDIDILCTAQKMPEREKDYIFSKYAVGVEYTMMYVPKDNDDIYYDDFDNFNGIKVGMLKGSYQNVEYKNYAKQNKFATTDIEYATVAQMEIALKEHEIDAMLIGSLSECDDMRLVAKFGAEPFYCMTGKQNAALMDKIDNAAKEMYERQSYFNGKLYEKYYSATSRYMEGITREEADYIASKPTLRIVSDDGGAASIMNHDQDWYNSMYEEILRMLSKISGIKFEYIDSKSEENSVSMLLNGEADLLSRVYAGGKTSENYGIGFTDPYLNARMLILGVNGVDFATDKPLRVAIPDSFVGTKLYLNENFPSWNVEVYDNIKECINAIERDKADVFIENAHFLQSYFNLTYYKDISIITTDDNLLPLLPLGLGVSPSISPIALSVLNKAIAAIPQDELNNIIIQNTITSKYNPTFYEIVVHNLPIIILVVISSALIIIFFLRKKEEKYREMALIDDLTGLWNKNRFKFEADSVMNKNKNTTYAVISMDIEKFKFYNESFGFAAGNDLLQQIAKVILETINNAAIFCRWVADDFTILLEYTGDEDLLMTIEKIKANMNKIELANKDHFRFVVKTGIYLSDFTHEKRTVTEMVDKANLAKDTVKGKHNVNTAFYDKGLDAHISNENEIELKMVDALNNHEFVVYYQPKIDLITEEVIGAEALVRWQDPAKGLVPPNSFIPLFERNGYIVKLDFYVYEEVCKKIREWKQAGKKIVPISINISRTHFNTQSFIKDLFTLVDRYEVEPELLELELTESVLENLNEGIMMTMMTLKEKGFNISIDDFGSGYSSLNLLKDVPFDVLKLDKGFLDQCDDSKKSTIIIQKVVEMARDIGVMTICEGVETREQADFLRSIGCNMAQGYLFAKPLPISDFEKRIK